MKILGYWINGKTFMPLDRRAFPEGTEFPRNINFTSGAKRKVVEVDLDSLVENLDRSGNSLGNYSKK